MYLKKNIPDINKKLPCFKLQCTLFFKKKKKEESAKKSILLLGLTRQQKKKKYWKYAEDKEIYG